MSLTSIQVKSEPTGPVAPTDTVTGKPAADKGQPNAPQTTPAQTPERPKWLPEKFKTAEEFAASYTELEKKLGTPPAEKPKEESGKEGQPPAEAPKADAALQPFYDEFAKTGKLSDDSYAALEKQGFSRAVVDAYARGVQAQRDESEAVVFNAVGGKDEYSKVVEWAAKNLPADEINAYNAMLESATPAQIALAASGLRTKYASANGSPAKLVHGKTTGGGVEPFGSTAQLTAAMNDPRYKTDQAYREEVKSRLSVSAIL